MESKVKFKLNPKGRLMDQERYAQKSCLRAIITHRLIDKFHKNK